MNACRNTHERCMLFFSFKCLHVGLSQKLLKASTRLKVRVLEVCWCPKTSSGCREEDIDSSSSSFYPPELLPQCFGNLISLYQTLC